MAVDDLWFSSRRQRGADGKLLPPEPTRRHGRGKRWRVRSPGLPSLHFEKKADADKADAARTTDVLRGTYIDPSLGRQTVAAYGRRWREAQVYKPSSVHRVETAFRLHIEPRLGQLPLADVRHSTVQNWVKSLDLAPATVRLVHAFLSGMFATAVRDQAVASNPCLGIKLPPIPRTEHLILTPAQVHALAEALPEQYRAAVYVGAGLGLRHGEAIGLEVEHVDFLRREVRVAQQVVSVTGRIPYLGRLKTETSRRTVELPKVTAEALAEHIRLHPPAGIEVVDETDPRKPRPRIAHPLFPSGSGALLHRAAWSAIWRPAAKAVGLPSGTGFHALRHFHATSLIFGGASVKTVQMALGHSTPSITLDCYVGIWPDQLDRTRALLDAALGSSTQDVPETGSGDS